MLYSAFCNDGFLGHCKLHDRFIRPCFRATSATGSKGNDDMTKAPHAAKMHAVLAGTDRCVGTQCLSSSIG
ncbi:hypothetical protein EIG75_20285 [Pseudomonas syringae]|nr:hypothetical protein [Pseudomonas syringae]NAO65234.1 hypothetical protein [Pseudomonas syringae]NAO73933.1 hypothetical protein [Pseudomonas syringae]NAP12855.1 hypothetical protein [Pseudomonas syringae]RRD10183.1 hypothetical protein EIG75_20285 [Pseudomonas syringae]